MAKKIPHLKDDVVEEAVADIDVRSDENARIAAPGVDIRTRIAGEWTRIMELASDLDISVKKDLSTHILRCRCASWVIRAEIARILTLVPEDRAKAGALLAHLAETDELAVKNAEIRNELLEAQGGLATSFLQKFPDFCSDRLDYSTRYAIAESAVLRAAETFDPSQGKLSTYAYRVIESAMRRAWKSEGKHTTISLDAGRKAGKGGGDEVTLYGTRADSRMESPSRRAERTELIQALHEVLAQLPTQLRRSIELVEGINETHKRHTPEEAAEIMTKEGLLTMERHVAIRPKKVEDWVKMAKRLIARHKDVFVQHTNAPEDGPHEDRAYMP